MFLWTVSDGYNRTLNHVSKYQPILTSAHLAIYRSWSQCPSVNGEEGVIKAHNEEHNSWRCDPELSRGMALRQSGRDNEF